MPIEQLNLILTLQMLVLMRIRQGKNTAAELGSGDMDVFGTPAMVALMEAAACDALRGGLVAGETSVGTHVDVKHLAATPVGMQVLLSISSH